MAQSVEYIRLISDLSNMFYRLDYSRVSEKNLEMVRFLHPLVAQTFNCSRGLIVTFEAEEFISANVLARVSLEFAVNCQYVAQYPGGLPSVVANLIVGYSRGLEKGKRFFGSTPEHVRQWEGIGKSIDQKDTKTFSDICDVFEERELLKHMYSYLSSFVHPSNGVLNLHTLNSDSAYGLDDLAFEPKVRNVQNSLHATAFACTLALGSLSYVDKALVDICRLNEMVLDFDVRSLLTLL
jgi:hypothetical protein